MSNVGQTAAADPIATSWNDADGEGFLCRAQSFTTGDHAGGYVLTALELRVGSPLSGDVQVGILNDASGSPPGRNSTTPLADWSFAGGPIGLKSLSPSGDLALGRGLTFWVTVCQGTTLKPVVLGATASDAEDAGGDSDWLIGDNVYLSNATSVDWDNASTIGNMSLREFVNMQFRVKGYATNTAPSFSSGSASRSVAENLTSGNVETPVTATDPDSGDVLAYSVSATGTTSAEMSHLADFNRDFSLDPASGQISVKATAMIDYETRTSYVVTYEVTDNKNAAGAADTAIDDTLTLTVNVNDVTETPPTTNTAPSFASGSASRTVAENLTSGNVGTPVTATDPDSGDVLAYSVAATGTTSAEMSHLADFNRDFSLDAASGQISVKATAMIDYEARTSYVVTYRVSDNKNAAGAADTAIDDTLTLTVNVTDVTETPPTTNTAPSFASGSASRMVAENRTSGNVETPVTATDPDSGDVLAYSVAAASVTDAALHLADFERDFSLSASGQIRVRAGAVIDHEARDTYVVTYRVSDNKNATGGADPVIDDTLTLTVNVSDVNEAGVVVVSGGLRPGSRLSAVLSDPDGAVSVVWQWARGDAAAGPFVDVAGASEVCLSLPRRSAG